VVSLLPLPFILASVILLLRAELASPRDVARVRLWKPTATALVFACAMLAINSGANPVYAGLIGAGLIACLIGDVYLIERDNAGRFLRGVGAFLIAHALFFLAFAYGQNMRGMRFNLSRELIAAAVIIALLWVVFAYVRDSLGPYRQALLIYAVGIGLMLHRAVVGIDQRDILTGPNLAALGAGLFVVSDVILLIGRFVFPSQDSKDALAVLGTYYAAITAIALSCTF
jgi:uncharacterized membrane protein YhhN